MAAGGADPEFLAELRAERVDETLVTWISTHCGTPAKFANFVDNKGEIQAEIVDKVPATVGCRVTRATMVALWRKHEASENRKLARQAAGIQEVDLEDPLDAPVRDRMLAAFAEYYRFRLRSSTIICDPLLARFKRELDKGTLTVCPVSRAVSQAKWSSSAARASRVQLSATVSMDVGTQAHVTVQIKTLVEYLRGLRLILTGLAIVGNHQVNKTDGSVREVRWAPWDECSDYANRVEAKAFPDSGSPPSVQQIRAADESTRELWAEWVRLESLTLGEAIRRSKVEAAPFWLWSGAEQTEQSRARENDSQGAPQAGKRRKVTLDDDNQPPPRHDGASYVRATKRGKQICEAWNTGGCQKVCPKKHLHICNYRLKDGSPCQATAHRRTQAH